MLCGFRADGTRTYLIHGVKRPPQPRHIVSFTGAGVNSTIFVTKRQEVRPLVRQCTLSLWIVCAGSLLHRPTLGDSVLAGLCHRVFIYVVSLLDEKLEVFRAPDKFGFEYRNDDIQLDITELDTLRRGVARSQVNVLFRSVGGASLQRHLEVMPRSSFAAMRRSSFCAELMLFLCCISVVLCKTSAVSTFRAEE